MWRCEPLSDDAELGRAARPDVACAEAEASTSGGCTDGAAALALALPPAFARIVSPYCLRRMALEMAAPVLGSDAVGLELASAFRASAFC